MPVPEPSNAVACAPFATTIRLGHAVRRLRERRGLSRADTCLRAGIALGTLASVERGDVRRRPPHVLDRIARVLDTTVEGLRALAAAEP